LFKACASSLDFQPSDADSGLFVKKCRGGRGPLALSLVHVDDGLLAGMKVLDAVIGALTAVFNLGDVGEGKFFLGHEILRDPPAKKLFVCQEKLTKEMIKKFLGKTTITPRRTPLPDRAKLGLESEPVGDPERTIYMQGVERILYLASYTRQGIAFAVRSLARFSACPTKFQMAYLKHVFCYQSGTRNWGICHGQEQLQNRKCFADASFVLEGSYSMSAWACIMHGGAISWDGRRQELTAQSSCKAEYISPSKVVREAMGVESIGGSTVQRAGTYSLCATIERGNQGALALAEHDTSHRRSKHRANKYQLVREHVEVQKVQLYFGPGSENAADVLTKSLGRMKFQMFDAMMDRVFRRPLGRMSPIKY
jgi:hypothetical protein